MPISPPMPDANATTPADEFAGPEFARELALVTPELERRVGIDRDDLASLLLLEVVKGFGPQKFKELHEAGLRPIDVLLEPERLPTAGKRGDAFRDAIRRIDAATRHLALARAVRQLVRASENDARIVTYTNPQYPPLVYASNNPIPVLYARGNQGLLTHTRAVAGVGSRETAPPYSYRHYEFATHAVRRGFSIVSGFALGADSIGHRAAFENDGSTVLVMPCGLDRCFPPENRPFYEVLTSYPHAAIVSEFPFGTAASTLTLRKRNKLIVAFARGVLLSQTSKSGGAMNAYRFALEQRKPVATFTSNGEPRTSGNKLIATGEADRRRGAHQGRLDDEPQRKATVFRHDEPDPTAWDAWLHQLSSST